MTECNDCGGCCNPVQLTFTPDQARAHGPRRMDPDDYHWITTALERIPYREGMAKAPHLLDGGRTTLGLGLDEQVIMTPVFFRCIHYDEQAHRCTNYENRPPICRGYPWYDEPPDPSKAIPLTCSYRADVGRDVHVQISGARRG